MLSPGRSRALELVVEYITLQYNTVWYSMVWYGMVWYGMVWFGMVWYGTVLYNQDTTFLIMARNTLVVTTSYYVEG